MAYLLTIVFALIGFAITSMIHHKKKHGHALVCPLGSDCNSVVYSSYSKFFGIDVVTIGLFYYGFIAVFYTTINFLGSFLPDYVFLVGFLLSVGAVIFSIYLLIVQFLVMKEWCFWCLASALATLVILISSGLTMGTSLYTFLLEYKIVIVIMHALSAALGVGTVLVTDVFFMKFLKDYKISESESEILDTLSQVVWFALGLLILTGLALFLPTSWEYLAKTKFIAKVVVVGVIVINGSLLNLFIAPKLIKISFTNDSIDHHNETHHLRKFAFAFGAVSIVSWISTFILGSVRSLPLSVLGILGIYTILIIIAVIGSQLFDYKISHQK